MTRYDFTKANVFLNRDTTVDCMYESVCAAMEKLAKSKDYLTREDVVQIWVALETCADFFMTIDEV